MTYCLLLGWKNQEDDLYALDEKFPCCVRFVKQQESLGKLVVKGSSEDGWHTEAILIRHIEEENIDQFKEEIGYSQSKQYYSFEEVKEKLKDCSQKVEEDLQHFLALCNEINKTKYNHESHLEWSKSTLLQVEQSLQLKKQNFLSEEKGMSERELIKSIKSDENIIERLVSYIPQLEEGIQWMVVLETIVSDRMSAFKCILSKQKRNAMWAIFGKQESPCDGEGRTKLRKVVDCIY